MFKIMDRRYLGVVLPIVILLALIIYPYLTVNLGEEILLETIPYDPTDLFRGDYVQLRYQISELDDSYFHESLNFSEKDAYRNHQMYAVLKQEGEVHIVDYLIREQPSDGVYLKCNVYMYRPFKSAPGTMEREPFTIEVDYNINRFYLKEGTGLELEKASREGTLLGKIKVYKGKGILVDILEKK